MPPLTPKVYHERQTRQLCALHTLNNLFQCKLVFQCTYFVVTVLVIFFSTQRIYQRAIGSDLHQLKPKCLVESTSLNTRFG